MPKRAAVISSGMFSYFTLDTQNVAWGSNRCTGVKPVAKRGSFSPGRQARHAAASSLSKLLAPAL